MNYEDKFALVANMTIVHILIFVAFIFQ